MIISVKLLKGLKHIFIEIVDENNETLYKKPYRINILPYQHWLGTKIYPELTCTYIVPNDNEIRRIVAEAGVKLKEWTGDPSFVGYQAGESEKVRLQAAAIYAALQKIILLIKTLQQVLKGLDKIFVIHRKLYSIKMERV